MFHQIEYYVSEIIINMQRIPYSICRGLLTQYRRHPPNTSIYTKRRAQNLTIGLALLPHRLIGNYQSATHS